MRRKLRIAALVGVGLLLTGGGVALFMYRATQRVPLFYEQALAQDTDAAAQANDECLQQLTALASDLRRPGQWQAVFTAEQINGWLAVDLERNYPELLPAEIQAPRVAISGQHATVGCKVIQGDVSTVFSLSLDVYLSEPNVLALRLRGAHAGALPMPLAKVLGAITEGARKADVPLEWRQNGGDPVAIISLAESNDADKFGQIDTIELRDGALWIAGHTDAREPRPRGLQPSKDEYQPKGEKTRPDDLPPVARLPSKRDRQRSSDPAGTDVDDELAAERAQDQRDQVDDDASLESLEADMKRIDQR